MAQVERDDLWQAIYEASPYNTSAPCPHYTHRQQGGWDVCAECETDAIYEAVTKHLVGRLLPSGGEVSTQWMIRDADGVESDYASDEREIRQSWAQGITWYDPDGSYELCRRYVVTVKGPGRHDWAYWPWEVVERHPAVPDSSAGQEGLPASTDGVAPPAGDEINK